MVNKIKTYRLKLGTKSENRQKTVVIGLATIIAVTTISFLIILNAGMFTPGYSKPFIDWLHTLGGKVFILSYLFFILIFILLSFNKTRTIIIKHVNKLASPLSLRLKGRYSIKSLAKRKKRLAYLTGFILLLIPIVLYTIINQSNVKAGWWNDNWHYRKKVTISNSGSSENDIQVAITLDTASLISQGKMREDCKDVRLYDYSTNKLYTHPYWIARCNSSSTDIWIKYSTLPAGDTIFYLYYGNQMADNTLESSGADVFVHFEDFAGIANGTDITQVEDNWTKDVDYSSTYTIEGEKLKMIHLGSAPNEARDGATYTFDSEITYNFAVDADVTVSDSNNYDFMFVVSDSGWTPLSGSHTTTALWSNINNEAWQGWQGTWANAQSGLIIGQTYTLGATFNISGDLAKMYVDGVYKIDRTFPDTGTTGLKHIAFGNFGYSSIDSTWYVDNIRVRKFLTTAPSVAFSSEETGPEPVAHWKFNEGYNKSLEQPLTKNEQQINIINRSFTVYQSSDYSPTDNSLGIIHWDADKYSNASIYFEAVMKRSSAGGGVYCSAALYTTGGSQVASSIVSTNSGNWVRLRSGTLTLSDDTDYTARLHCNGGIFPSTGYIKSARLIIIQSDATKLTDTETQIEVGNVEKQSSNTATQLTNKKIYYYDSTQFTPAPTAYFEASLRNSQPTIEQQINIIDQYFTVYQSSDYSPTDNSLGIIHWDADKYAGATVYFEAVMKRSSGGAGVYVNGKLYTTGGSEVASSAVSTNSGSWIRVRSGAVTLTDDTDYTVRIHCNGGIFPSDGFIQSARLIIIQSDATKITDTETQIEVGDEETGFTNESAADLTDYKIYQYDQDQFAPVPESNGDIEFHASLKIDDATATSDSVTAELYNKTDSTVVATASHSGDTNWTLIRTTNVDGDADWDTTNDDEYIVRVYCTDNNGGGCSGNIANAKIAINQSVAGGITDVEVVHQQVNTAKTDADATYTSQDFLNRFNPDLETSQRSFAGGTFAYYYESTLKTSSGTGYAQLYNTSDSSVISNSEVATTSASYTRVRSGDITSNLPQYPQNGAKNLDTQLKNSATNTTTSSSSWIIVQVTNLATSGVTVYADLYNLTDTTQVGSSEVSSTSTSWGLVRSSSITLTTGKEYVVRLRSSINNVTVHMQGAKIILDQTDADGISSLETVQQMVNTLATDSDTGYTDQDFLNEYNSNNNHFVADNYNGSSVHFEATMKTSVGGGSNDAFAILTVDGGSTVSGSELETSDTNYDLVRTSSSIGNNMPTSASNMDTQLKNELTATTSVSNSWMVIRNENIIPSLVNNSIANNLTGSKVGATWQSECKLHMCLAFDGVDDSVIVADDAKLNYAASDSFTLTGWFKRSETISGTEVLVAKHNSAVGTDGGYKVLLESDGNVTFGIDDDQTSFPEDNATSTTNGYEDNQWHHFAAVKSGTTSIKLYIDGEEVASDATLSATGTLANTDAFYIGIDGDGTSNGFEGSIDDIKVYPYARTADEIKVDYIGGSGVLGVEDESLLTDNLSLYWKFDETSANTCDDTNDACDSSGNQNHARWEDNATNTSGKFASAVDFDGTNDRVATSSSNAVPSSWSKRKSITVTNNIGSDLTDYQVKLAVIYDSDMLNDFNDLRFTNSSGTTLDHWVEKYTTSTEATVWVEVDSLPASSGTTIYMHYGNQNASSSSNGDNTFEFFDDFSTNTLGTKWTGDISNFTISGGELHGSNNTYRVQSNVSFTGNYETVTRIYTTTGYTHGFMSNGFFESTSNSYGWLTYGSGASSSYTRNNSSWINEGAFDWKQWVRATVKVVGTSASATVVGETSGSDSASGTNGISNEKISLGERYDNSWTGGAYDADWDWLFVKKAASTEPSPSFNSEESYVWGETTVFPSMSAWVYADTLGATDRVIIARNNSSSYDWAIYNDSSNPGKLAFTSDGETNTGVSNTTLSTGSWYHIAMTVDSNKTRLYINGQLDKEIANSGDVPGTGDISVGADPDGTDGWDGKIDDVRIYSKTLDKTQVMDLYKWAPGPVAYYNFDEGEGTSTVYDKSGNNNHGTMNGSMTEDDWVPGRIGQALEFDGNNDNVQIDDSPSFDFSSTPFTISAWVKASSLQGDNYVQLIDREGASGNEFSLLFNNGATPKTLRWYVNDGDWQYTESTTTFSAPTDWIHVVGVYDGSQLHIYVNGIKEGTPTTQGAPSNTSQGIRFAQAQSAGNSGRELDGILDEIKIYNYIRTPEQIIEDMNAGHPAPGSPVGSSLMTLRLDEGYGDTAYDSSSNGYNGNLAGTCPGDTTCPSWTNSGKFGKALSFDGGDYAGVTLPIPTTDFTYSTWVYMTNNTDETILNASNGSGGNELQIYIDSDETVESGKKWRVQLNNITVLGNSTEITSNTWHHLVLTRSGSSVTLYVDNKIIDTGTNSDILNFSSCQLLIGVDHDSGCSGSLGNYLNGILDEINVYTFALDESQIAQDMNQGKSSVMGAISTDSSGNASMSSGRSYCPPGDNTASCTPIAEWKLDENSDTSAYDTSENNYTGTFSSSPVWQHAGNCHNGSCLEFDGSDDYVYTTYTYDTTKFIGELWFKLNQDDTNQSLYSLATRIGLGASQDSTARIQVTDTNLLKLLIWVTSPSSQWTNIDGTTTITTDEWHHVYWAFTNSDKYELYLDGILEASNNGHSYANIEQTGTVRELIGAGYENDAVLYPTKGRIDQVRLYNYDLSPAQIAWNFNRGKPIGYWKLNECQGETAYDSSVFVNNGTITEGGSGDNNGGVGTCDSGAGDEMWDNGTNGKRNASLDFDGTDDRSDTSVVSDFNLTGSDFTIAAWIKTSQSAFASYLSVRDTSGGGSGILAVFPINATSGKVSLDTWDYASSRVTSNTTVNDGQWHHVVATYDSGTGLASLYVDGKFDNSDTQSGNSPNVSKMVRLGGNVSPGGGMLQPYDGQIDEVKVFNYKLTQQQILTVFREGAVKF